MIVVSCSQVHHDFDVFRLPVERLGSQPAVHTPEVMDGRDGAGRLDP